MAEQTMTDVEQVFPGWQDLAQSVAQELTAWRRAHPRATLEAIEGAVSEAMQRLQARALEQVVHTSARADLAAHPDEPRPACGACGGAVHLRGRKKRTVRPARQRAALDLERTYAVCSACGTGLFPPG